MQLLDTSSSTGVPMADPRYMQLLAANFAVMGSALDYVRSISVLARFNPRYRQEVEDLVLYWQYRILPNSVDVRRCRVRGATRGKASAQHCRHACA